MVILCFSTSSAGVRQQRHRLEVNSRIMSDSRWQTYDVPFDHR